MLLGWRRGHPRKTAWPVLKGFRIEARVRAHSPEEVGSEQKAVPRHREQWARVGRWHSLRSSPPPGQ